MHSVNTDNLSTLVNELGQAFNDQGPALSALLDSSNCCSTPRSRTCRTRWL